MIQIINRSSIVKKIKMKMMMKEKTKVEELALSNQEKVEEYK